MRERPFAAEVASGLAVVDRRLPLLGAQEERAGVEEPLAFDMMMSNNGVMMGTRIVVSAEWVERVNRLVRAGVLSLPAVSAAVRIQAGQMMMVHGGLPRGVREALGDGPEVRSMRVTDRGIPLKFIRWRAR